MNNGDIVIIARREVERILDDYDEVTVNRVRYQIPEDTVILDFFGRVSGESRCVPPVSSLVFYSLAFSFREYRMAMLRKPIKRHLFDQLDLSRPNGHHRAMSGSLSPLTSLDESDDDMNGSQAVRRGLLPPSQSLLPLRSAAVQEFNTDELDLDIHRTANRVHPVLLLPLSTILPF